MGRWGYGKGPQTRDASGKRVLPEIVPTPDEEWRPVVGWDSYSVSSCGRVRNERTGKLVPSSFKGQDGYVGVGLSQDNKKSWPLTATIVAAAFIGPRLPGLQIDHRDGNKLNNFASNLEYVSHRVNHERAADMELHAWGERHAAAKLTDAIVREIRASTETERELADRYGVAPATIHNARVGATWRHLTDDNASLDSAQHQICCACCTELAALKRLADLNKAKPEGEMRNTDRLIVPGDPGPAVPFQPMPGNGYPCRHHCSDSFVTREGREIHESLDHDQPATSDAIGSRGDIATDQASLDDIATNAPHDCCLTLSDDYIAAHPSTPVAREGEHGG